MSDFLEFLDEHGQALLVNRGEVAFVRDADPSINLMRSVMILKSGETIGLQTPFAAVVERLEEEKD